MTLDSINTFLKHYGIDQVNEFNLLPLTTSGNISYATHSIGDKYVIRTLIRQSETGAEDERFVQEQLNASGLTTPLYMTTLDGKVVSQIDGIPAVLSKYISGSRQRVDTLDLAESMGSTLARIHMTLHSLQLRSNKQQWFNPVNTVSQLNHYIGPEKEFITSNTRKYAEIFSKDLPHAITHGDFHTNNIFSHNDKVTAVFDFESAEYSVRILDIARLYLTYRKVTELDPDKILSAILLGYDSTIPFGLTKNERAELTNAFIYVALLSSVSIYNHGNSLSSTKYLEIAKLLIL